MPAQAQQQQPQGGGEGYEPTQSPLVFEQFNGINTSTSRPGVDDSQMFWCDGFFPIGPRELRTLYDVGTSIWTPTNGTIEFFDFANIGATPYMIGFTSLGDIWAINTNTLVATKIANAGTIANPARANVALSQYGSRYIIIVSAQTNGYFIWDGTTFYSPGASFGGGTVPTGISGNAIEIYQGRVWVANGATVNFSVAGSVIDFTTGNGGGSFTSSDSFLRVGYYELIQTNGFLYLIGNSSINYISGVQTSGSPPTTTFTNQNADPEIGTVWPGTVDVLSRNIVFANSFGAHVSYGAAVTKVSEALDGVYNTANNFGGKIAQRGEGHSVRQEGLDTAARYHRPDHRAGDKQAVPVGQQEVVLIEPERGITLYSAPGNQLGADGLWHRWSRRLSAVHDAEQFHKDGAIEAMGQASWH